MIGLISAVVYVALMIFAYGSQIIKIFKTSRTEGLSLKFFVMAWLAVILRIITEGSIIHRTSDFNAIILSFTETVVFLGLSIVIIQVLWLRRK